MTCLLENKENTKAVDSLAKTLSTVSGKVDESLLQSNAILAYHILACNNGWHPRFNTKGEPSLLYRALLDKCQGDEKAAIMMKSYIYTKEYAASHGNWLANDEEEPSYESIQPELEREEIQNLFPNSNIDVLEQFLLNQLYSKLINESFGGLDIDPSASIHTIDKDRSTWVNLQISSGSAKSRYELEQEYNKNKVREILENTRKKLIDAWNLKLDANGNAINPYNEADFEKYKGLSPYHITMFRCLFVNNLLTKLDDFKLYDVLLSIIRSFVNNASVPKMTSDMVRAYFNMFKGTPVVINALVASGKITRDNRGDVDERSLNRAIDDLCKELDNESYKYSADKKFTKIRNTIDNFTSYVSNILNIIKLASAKYISKGTLHIVPAALLGVPTALLTGSVWAGVAAFTTACAISKVSSDNIIKHFGDNYNAYLKYHEALRLIIFASALNEEIEQDEDYADTSLLSEILSNTKGDSLQKALYKLKRNIGKLLSSLNAASQDNYKSEDIAKNLEQINRLNELLLFCNDALSANPSIRMDSAHLFFTQYINTADDAINNAILRLEEMSEDIEHLDAHELMRLKTDVIGAYNSTINNFLSRITYILPIRPDNYDEDKHEVLAQFIKNTLCVNINRAKDLFSRVLDEYSRYQVESYLKDTAYKSLPKDRADKLKENTIKWLANEIGNGNISPQDKYIMPARDNTSPIIRMLSQRLKEIETLVLKEAGEAGAELETLRVAQRSMLNSSDVLDRMFLNPLNKYCERDVDGLFTGYFKSDTNFGQYYADLKTERDKLIKKHKITVNGKQMLWDEDGDRKYTSVYYIDGNKIVQTFNSKWLAYNTDLILWMAGATSDKDGNYRLVSSDEPRVHRRYNYQYYLDKVRILGKEGCDMLSNVNQQIARIQKSCLTKVEVNGVVRTIPIIAKLTEESRKRLQMAMDRKAQLSNCYYVKMDDDMVHITGIQEKDTDFERDLAFRFLTWNELKRTKYYDSNAKPNYDLYNAVVEQYEQRLSEAESKYGASSQEYIKINEEYNKFKNDATSRVLSDKLTSLFSNERHIEYDITDPSVLEYFQLRSILRNLRKRILSTNEKRTPDLTKVGKNSSANPNNVRNLWRQIVQIDKRLNELRSTLTISSQDDSSVDLDKLLRKDFVSFNPTPTLDSNQKETTTPFYKFLINDVGLMESDLKYVDSEGNEHWCSLLKREDVDQSVLDLIDERSGAPLFNTLDDAFEELPTGIFSETLSLLIDDKFDESDSNYILVNKNRKEYNNLKEYNKIKDDPVYKALLSLMDKSWENYPGLTRRNKYLLPQRETNVTSMFGRAYTQKGHFWKTTGDAWKYFFSNLVDFNSRDTDINQQVLTRSDGTVVELIPTRFISTLADSNRIDSDLISSVIDFYTESLRYKYRSRLAPVMEAMYFKLTGGFEAASDSGSTAQADVLKNEMSRALYGRETIGSGEGGRIMSNEVRTAKLSKLFRAALHKRLMSHNWLSVLKNGLDSFFNMCQQVFTGKNILTLNIIRALGKLFWDGDNTSFTLINQITGITRSKATNMTQALMLLNGVQSNIHDRFEGLWKTAARRLLEKSSSIEFEAVDYTAKALITEAVYDSYRLVRNPITHTYEYMNENEAEYAYMSNGAGGREEGYRLWSSAKDFTLRNAYKYDSSTGLVKMKELIDLPNGNTVYLLDIIRPKNNLSISDDSRSSILETKVRTTIKQLSSVVNGMLDAEDKNALARNYAGAILTAFRGWMITQSGEFYKNGTDFFDYSTDVDTGKGFSKYINALKSIAAPQIKEGSLDDRNFEGQYNFATGTVDKGLHVGLLSNLAKNFGSFLLMMTVIPEFIGDSKSKYLKRGMSMHDIYQMRNFVAATHAFALTVMLTCMAFSWYNDDDDDDDYAKTAKSLLYTAAIASIVERFPQLGFVPFLLGASDIINAATVGVTLLDDAHFLIDTASDIINMSLDLVDNGEISDDLETCQQLINGSFKGKRIWQRNLTRAGALFNFDSLPYLLALDGLNQTGMFGNEFEDVSFRDFNLNYYKNTTTQSNIGRANWYSDQVPVSTIKNWLLDTPFPITKPKGGSSKQSKNNISF